MFDPHLGQVDELLLRVDDVHLRSPLREQSDNLRQDVTHARWRIAQHQETDSHVSLPSCFSPSGRRTMYTPSSSPAPATPRQLGYSIVSTPTRPIGLSV